MTLEMGLWAYSSILAVRPMRRCLLMSLRPLEVFMRARKPCLRILLILLFLRG